MSLHAEATDQLGAKIGATLAYGGSGGAVFFGLTVNELGVVVGIFTAVTGLAVNFYFKWREDQRQEQYWADRRKGN